jgi:DNA-binding XRE family transcriptional regulator
MTTQTIPSQSASGPASSARTASGEVVPYNSRSLPVFDARSDELAQTGIADEFDIDQFIAAEDQSTRDAVAGARPQIASALYGAKQTLASLRLRAGLSQRELAERCGIEQPHISRYETGRHEPGLLQARAMARILGVSLEEFVDALHGSARNG